MADRFALWLSKGTHVDGLWVGGFLVDKSSPALPRVWEALRLIKTCDPIRYHRLLQDLDRVWVTLIPDARGSYDHALRACKLDERFLAADVATIGMIASVVVHEATHARLFACGIGYDENIRARVERVCIDRQIAFATKLSDGLDARVEAEQMRKGFPSNYPADFWSNTAFSGRFDKGSVEMLRYLGTPDWVIRTIFWVRPLILQVLRGARAVRRTLSKK